MSNSDAASIPVQPCRRCCLRTAPPPRRTWYARRALFALLPLAAPTASGADAIHDDSLASAVPASAGFFIEFDQLGNENAADRAVSANRLYQLLVGPEDAQRGLSVDWRRTIRALGLKPGEATKELLARRVAIAAPSWKRLGEGILLVRIERGDNSVQKNIFPPDSEDTIDGRGDVIVYRSRNVLSVANRRETLIVSQRRTEGSLYRQAVDLMMEPTRPSLANDHGFARALRALPQGLDGLVYLGPSSGQEAATGFLPVEWKGVGLGMYLRDHGAEFVFHADSPAAPDRSGIGPVPIERVGLLPQTTLGVWTTELDVRAAFRDIVQHGITDDTPAFLRLLAGAFDVEIVVEKCFGGLGPRAIVTWDQQMSTGPDIPQIAVLLEADNAIESAKACADAVQIVVDWLDLQNKSVPQPRVRLSQTVYLGVTLYEVTVPWSTGSSGDRAPPPPLVPAFAALDDWFVVAASADQIRNMIDARWGLTPNMKNMIDIDGADKSPVALAVAQPALAAQVVDTWLNRSDGIAGRLLGSLISGGTDDIGNKAPTPKLGIGMKSDEQPGAILVARVYPTGRAHGQLRPGDRIVGVNEHLLTLSAPTVDLRRIVSQPPSSGQWVFRVVRDGETLDVVVPAGTPRKISQRSTDPAGALRQLQGLFELVEFASFHANRVSRTQVNGSLTLRFTPVENGAHPSD